MIVIDIQEIIDDIPLVLDYVVVGYVFLSIIGFMASKSIEDFTVKVSTSIVTSYILNSIYKYSFKDSAGTLPFLLKSLLATVVLAWLIGLLLKAHWFNKFLTIIGFGRTTNSYFWKDTLNKESRYKIYMKDSDIMYEGFLRYIEEASDTPYLSLKYYRVCKASEQNNLHYDTVYDYNSESPVNNCKPNVEYSMILNMADVDHIEIKTDVSEKKTK